jgi:hypothetical protein
VIGSFYAEVARAAVGMGVAAHDQEFAELDPDLVDAADLEPRHVERPELMCIESRTIRTRIDGPDTTA